MRQTVFQKETIAKKYPFIDDVLDELEKDIDDIDCITETDADAELLRSTLTYDRWVGSCVDCRYDPELFFIKDGVIIKHDYKYAVDYCTEYHGDSNREEDGEMIIEALHRLDVRPDFIVVAVDSRQYIEGRDGNYSSFFIKLYKVPIGLVDDLVNQIFAEEEVAL